MCFYDYVLSKDFLLFVYTQYYWQLQESYTFIAAISPLSTANAKVGYMVSFIRIQTPHGEFLLRSAAMYICFVYVEWK